MLWSFIFISYCVDYEILYFQTSRLSRRINTIKDKMLPALINILQNYDI